MEKQKTVFNFMADMLAEMAERAHKAEQERDDAKKTSTNWYDEWSKATNMYRAIEQQLQTAEKQLVDEIEAHKKTKRKLAALIEKYETANNAPNCATEPFSDEKGTNIRERAENAEKRHTASHRAVSDSKETAENE